MNLPLLNSRSRLMMFAPHPDDESLAAGVFLQRAVASGAAVRIVYATDGERNCWPQRLLERKVLIRDPDRIRWGARRQAESLAALRTLGIGREQVEFLSLPDQGVTDLLLAGCRETMRRLADTITAWEPTHLLVPSMLDTHPDHSGLAVLLEVVCDDYLPPHSGMVRLQYLVHGASKTFARRALDFPHSPREMKTKQSAIVCHITQVALSRRRFLSYAKRPERFLPADAKLPDAGDGPMRAFTRDRAALRLHVAFTLKPLRAEDTPLYLVGRDAVGRLRCLRAALPRRTARIDLIDCATGAIASVGRYLGDAFRAEILLPTHGFAFSRSLFVKLDRRAWFFDEAGWLEVRASIPEAAMRGARALAAA